MILASNIRPVERKSARPALSPKQRRASEEPAEGRIEADFHLRTPRESLFAVAIFVAMFTLYVSKHPAGFSAKVINTATTKGTLLALVAMAQTIPVVTAGLDLSVGMVFVLANCLASNILVGSPLQTTVGALTVLVVGSLCGAVNGAIVVYGRLQPIIATLATGAIYYGFALWLRPRPGGRGQHRFRRCHGGFVRRKYFPATLILLLGVVLFHLGFPLSAIRSRAHRVCDRLFRAGSLYVRHSNRPSEVPRLHRGWPFLVDRRLAAHLYHVFLAKRTPC